jgi:3-deoxy-D-manno-octulosonic-acid transferase
VHNVLEAAVYGLPCAFGPEYQKYQEAKELIACNAAVSCHNANQFTSFFSALLSDSKTQQDYSSAAKKYVAQRGGATSIIVHYLEEKNWLKTL